MQSSALHLMSCENALAKIRGEPPVWPQVPIYDISIFCDLGFEPPWVKKQVEFLANAGHSCGVPLVILDSPLYTDFMENFGERRTISIPWWTIKEDGHKSKMPRNCTIDYKVELISKYVRWELLGYKKGQRLDAKVEALPEEYYVLTPSSRAIIPKGSFSGLIEVQLTDAFFEDPKALTGAYVIPIRITGSPDTENILYGKPVDGKEDSADIHVSEDWSEKPMHFALFGVKYVNPWHGSWLRRGALIVRDRSGAVIEEECVTYREEFVEQDEVVKLTTTSLTSLETELSVGAERWTLALSVDEQTRRMTVASTPASAIEVSGTGSYKENGDSWGGTPENPTPRDAVYLNYFYERENGQRCEVLDTLVFRDRGIVFEADRPTIK